jgi:hypothetical protein
MLGFILFQSKFFKNVVEGEDNDGNLTSPFFIMFSFSTKFISNALRLQEK